MKYSIKEKIEILRRETNKMFPNAVTELNYKNDFQLLIAIIMSAQTTDKQVNKVNDIFFKTLIKPSDGVKLGVENIEKYINTVSFYKNKSKNIFRTCEILNSKKIPKNIEELIKLPGVGIKTAKVFLSITENAPYLGVDTHVHRVLNRVGIVKTKTANETDKKAEKIIQKKDLTQLHHSLIFFGRYHCIARKPKCLTCPISNICSYNKKEN